MRQSSVVTYVVGIGPLCLLTARHYRTIEAAMWFENALHDIQFAIRMASRSPSFTALAVITLALGVGSTTAIFSVVKAVLLKQLPYENPDRVVALSEVDPAGPTTEWV